MAELRECYRLLEVEPGASPEEVKCAYRELVKIWHPDRFTHDPNLQRRASEKLKLINLAYEQISNAGFSVPPMPQGGSASRSAEHQARPSGRSGSPESNPDPQYAAPQQPPPTRRRGQSFGWRLAQFAAAVIIIISVFKIVLSTVNSQRGRIADPRSAPQPPAPQKNAAVTTPPSVDAGGSHTFVATNAGSSITRTNSSFTVPLPTDGMLLIPAGAFTMGDTLDGMGDALPISVNVSAFYMDRNLVSKTQWDEVYTWAIAHGYRFDNVGAGKASTHPVQKISWYDVVKWCNARSEKEGGKAAYYTDVGLSRVYRSRQVSPSVKWNSGYRLPTEAEWEKAARGRLSGKRFPWGNTISRSQANYIGNTGYSYDLGPNSPNATKMGGGGPYTSPVGSFAANGYGLNDMAGNVFQWCWDWYGTPYAGGTDPRGAASGVNRVIRGGSWRDSAAACRSARRSTFGPDDSDISGFGFRAVLSPDQP